MKCVSCMNEKERAVQARFLSPDISDRPCEVCQPYEHRWTQLFMQRRAERERERKEADRLASEAKYKKLLEEGKFEDVDL